MNRIVSTIFFVLAVCSGNAYSETESNVVGDSAGFQQDSAAVTDNQSANTLSSGNSISQGVVQEELKDSSQVQYNQENDQRGREYKANDSKAQANVGSAIAAATGAALIARGSPMLGSPIAAVRAAGADLMAKGALELAQAGASKSAANDNKSQENLLTQNYDEGQGGGSPAGSSNEPKVEINSPELQNLLASRGISSDEFAEAISSGALTSADDVLRAIGEDPSTISSEDQEQANSLSNNLLGSIFGELKGAPPEPLGKPDLLRQNMDEGNGSEAAGGVLSAAGAGGVGVAGAATAGAVSPMGETGVVSSGAMNGSAPKAKPAAGEHGEGADSFFAEGRDFLAKLLGAVPGSTKSKGSSDRAQALRKKTERELKLMGISPTRRGNIFEMASQNFRSFSRWRRPKLAMQP